MTIIQYKTRRKPQIPIELIKAHFEAFKPPKKELLGNEDFQPKVEIETKDIT